MGLKREGVVYAKENKFTLGINAFETWLRLSALCRGREEIFLDERLESGMVEDRWEEKPYCRHSFTPR